MPPTMKIIKFLKDWTLPVSMGTGALLYLVFAYVPQLDEAALFFDPVMEAILPMFMFLVLSSSMVASVGEYL